MVLEQSYRREAERVERQPDRLASVLGAPDSIDALRHRRMYDHAQSLIAAHPEAHWLTVGDGGADAEILRRMGVRHLTASSISDAALHAAAALGHLEGVEIRSLNAEKLALDDRSVDFIFCKEAFHHFPRAPLALYEFLRVAREGVILIEPCDQQAWRPLNLLRTAAKLALRRRPPRYEMFEPVGNYIYRLSRHEIFRSLTALQWPWFAWKGFNDFYYAPLGQKSRFDSGAMTAFRLAVGVQDGLARLGAMNSGLAVCVIPSVSSTLDLRPVLRAAGFALFDLPRNPYSGPILSTGENNGASPRERIGMD